MKKGQYIRQVAVLLLISFLAGSVSTRAFGSTTPVDDHEVSVHPIHSDSPSGQDNQLPYEEKEKEIEDKSQSSRDNLLDGHFLLIYDAGISIEINADRRGIERSYFAPQPCGNTHRTPLFLANRRLLI